MTYQQERYVAEALRSVLEQTEPPEQVVVVDDGSTDGTLERVRSVGGSRMTVIALPHRGIAALAETYNAGLDFATGDLVSTIEGDDRWRPEKLARHRRAFAADSSIVVAHGPYAVIGARGTLLRAEVRPPLAPAEGPYDAYPRHLLASYVMPVTATLRRSALLEVGGFQQLGPTPHVDYPTYLPLAELGRFHYEPRVLAEWRKHGASGTSRLAGVDLAGAELCKRVALASRERSRRGRLPPARRVEAEWENAHGRQIWNAVRVLLLRGRHAEARAALEHARGHSYALGLRLRLALAELAARLGWNLEWLLALAGRRSPFTELE